MSPLLKEIFLLLVHLGILCLLFYIWKTKQKSAFFQFFQRDYLRPQKVTLKETFLILALTFIGFYIDTRIMPILGGAPFRSLAFLFLASTSVFFAPIWEEVLFRGLLLSPMSMPNFKMKKHLALRKSVMTLCSAILFASAHLGYGLEVRLFVYYILMGLFFAGIYLWKKNLSHSMIAHSFWSLLVILIKIGGIL